MKKGHRVFMLEGYGVTGTRSFCIDQTGILRGADKGGKPVDENDPPIDSL